jgi:hypothetical protein
MLGHEWRCYPKVGPAQSRRRVPEGGLRPKDEVLRTKQWEKPEMTESGPTCVLAHSPPSLSFVLETRLTSPRLA